MKNFNKITTGDCIKGMSKMPPESVDLIVADPPYNIGIDYGDGVKADKLPDADYAAWISEWLSVAVKTLSSQGAIWIICGQEYAGDYQLAIRAAGLHWRNTVTWVESFGANCQRKFNRTSRPMFYAVKDPKKFTFNLDALTTPSARQTKYKDKRANQAGKVFDDVWMIPRVCGTFNERVPGVPTQLPLTLVRRVVLGLSRPGDLVLDPFTGSGTTGVVCVESRRRFQGFELRKKFANIAKKRIEKEAKKYKESNK